MLLEWEECMSQRVFLNCFIRRISSIGPTLNGDIIWLRNSLKAGDRPLQFTKQRMEIFIRIKIRNLADHPGPCPSPDLLPLLSSQTAPKISACLCCFCMEVRKSRSGYPCRKCYFIELTVQTVPWCFRETESLVSRAFSLEVCRGLQVIT